MQIFDEHISLETIDEYEGLWSIHKIKNFLKYVETKIDTTKPYTGSNDLVKLFKLVYGEDDYRVKNYVQLDQ